MSYNPNKNPNAKYRSWWFQQKISYLPENWRTILHHSAMPCCAIVHDKDPSEVEGRELVDPHIHVIYSFGNQVRYKSALQFAQLFNVEHCEPAATKDGAVRYLLHIGQEPKHVYDESDLELFGGFKYDSGVVHGVDFSTVFNFILKYQPRTIAELVMFALQLAPEMVPFIQGRITPFDTLLRSMSGGVRNLETGELELPLLCDSVD